MKVEFVSNVQPTHTDYMKVLYVRLRSLLEKMCYIMELFKSVPRPQNTGTKKSVALACTQVGRNLMKEQGWIIMPAEKE